MRRHATRRDARRRRRRAVLVELREHDARIASARIRIHVHRRLLAGHQLLAAIIAEQTIGHFRRRILLRHDLGRRIVSPDDRRLAGPGGRDIGLVAVGAAGSDHGQRQHCQDRAHAAAATGPLFFLALVIAVLIAVLAILEFVVALKTLLVGPHLAEQRIIVAR